jgi:hypothetical protein
MTDFRKPIPKTQKEISNELVEPYSKAGLSNPNDSLSDPSVNRGLQLSFKGDTVKPYTVSIKDIDETIMYYFTEVIKPYVYQNGERISVPVLYGDSERWKNIQKDGYYRDFNGSIMMPILVFRRNSITKNRSIANKLDANQPHLYSSLVKKYSKRNFYDNFNVLTNTIPEKEFYAIVMPDYVTISYSCVVSTYYVEQLNKIVEAINYASDSYWGDPARFKFRAMIDSFTTIQEVNDGQERAVKSTFDIKLNGYIIPDILQKDIASVKKIPMVSKVTFGLETVQGSTETFAATSNKALGKASTINVVSSNNIINNITNGSVDPAALTYLNTNKSLNASAIGTPNNANFGGAAFLPAPSGFPATSKDNFSFFINGQYVDPLAVISFTDSGASCTLILDVDQLGFSIQTTDIVTAIGKFA